MLKNLPFHDKSYDIVMSAFGVRNFGQISAGLAETHRVLRQAVSCWYWTL